MNVSIPPLKVFKALKSSKVLVIIEPPALIIHLSVSLLPSIICPIMFFFPFCPPTTKTNWRRGNKTGCLIHGFAKLHVCTNGGLHTHASTGGKGPYFWTCHTPSSLSVPFLYFASLWAAWFVVQPRWMPELPCSLSAGYEMCWDDIFPHLGCYQRSSIDPPPL